MNKTATSLQNKPLGQNQYQNKLLSQTTKMNMSKFPDSRLKNVLVQNKLDSLQEKLKEKGVKSYERFVELMEEQIDEWKDVAVGWRIKLKKLVRMCRDKVGVNLDNSQAINKPGLNPSSTELKQVNSQIPIKKNQ